MTGRMESMENLTRDVAGFAKQRKVFHPSHRPLEIVTTIPTFPQPRLRRFSLANQKQGDISTRLTKGTFLFGLDTHQHSVGNTGRMQYSRGWGGSAPGWKAAN